MNRQPRPKYAERGLSFSQQVRILSKLTAIADEQERLVASLFDSGYSAFYPWQQYISSFCEQSEAELHRLYMKEEAKIWIGSPDGLPGHLTGDDRGYVSSVIVAMRHDRDIANGITYSEIRSPHTWKRYIDPCTRRLERRGIEGDPLVKLRREKMDNDTKERRAAEVLRHASANQVGNEQCLDVAAEYASKYRKALEKALHPIGFVCDEFREGRYFPVLSKSLGPYWDLCWSPASDRTLRFLPKIGPTNGELRTAHDLCLYVCPKGRRGPVDVPVGFEFLDIMRIRYDRVIPGFTGAYYSFADMPELEIVLGAHTTLYGLISEFVENILFSELVSSDGAERK